MPHHVAPFDDPVSLPAGSHLRIDENTLKDCPLDANSSIYTKLSRKVTTLTIHGVSEDQLEKIFSIFPNILHLSLEGVTILKQDGSVPDRLICLQLIDCRIHTRYALAWFRKISRTLLRIQLSHSTCKLSFGHGGSISALLYPLQNVQQVTVEDTKKCVLKNVLPHLQSLTYDVPSDCVDDFLITNTCKHTIRTLVLRSCPRNIKLFTDYHCLENLHIIDPVPRVLRSELRAFRRWETFDVPRDRNDPAINQIFVLNNDCLAHILQYLTLKEWLAIARIHLRWHQVVHNYMFCSAQFTLTDETVDHYRSAMGLGILFHRWAPLSKSLTIFALKDESWLTVLPFFTNLRKLSLNRTSLSDKILELIPDNLETLELNFDWIHPMIKEVFGRLAPTLTTLRVCGPLNMSDLTNLNNIRELNLKCYNTTDIDQIILKNRAHLEQLEFESYEPKWPTGPFPKLRVLRIYSLFQVNVNPGDFPSLQEVTLSFRSTSAPINEVISCVAQLTGLRFLQVNGCKGPWDLKRLYPLGNLRQLLLRDTAVQERHVLDIVEHLPELIELGTDLRTFSLDFEVELQRNLKAANRTIALFHVGSPGKKVVMGKRPGA